MAAPIRNLLITGATGKQGGALITSLLSNPATANKFKLYGLTRNAASLSAIKLAERRVTMIQGDTTKPAAVFDAIGAPVWGVFSVTNPGKNEEQEAIPLIDASVAHGVKHFVFASVDRGGPQVSDSTATPVPHFISKFNIEAHLRAVTAGPESDMSWTNLRPVTFLENLVPGLVGRTFATAVKQLDGVKLNLVSSKDVGAVAAKVFEDDAAYRGKSLSLVGEQLDFEGMNAVFKKVMGTDLPLAPGFIASFFKWAVGDLGMMFKWFGEGGFAWDVKQVEGSIPVKMQDFETWLRTSSQFEVPK